MQELGAFTTRAQVQSLVKELRCCKPPGIGKTHTHTHTHTHTKQIKLWFNGLIYTFFAFAQCKRKKLRRYYEKRTLLNSEGKLYNRRERNF